MLPPDLPVSGSAPSPDTPDAHPAAQRSLKPGVNRRSYFGVTANYHIICDAGRDRPDDPSARLVLSAVPPDVALLLMDRFWTCYNDVIRVVHREAFESGEFYSVFLHICMLALACRYAKGHGQIATDLHREARRLAGRELEAPGGVPSIQALLLLGDLECGVGSTNTGWLYAGRSFKPGLPFIDGARK
jgi:hypothetical protein